MVSKRENKRLSSGVMISAIGSMKAHNSRGSDPNHSHHPEGVFESEGMMEEVDEAIIMSVNDLDKEMAR